MSLIIYIKNNDTQIKCTYDEWNIFRQSIMKSFIKLLEEKIILNKYKSKETQNDINDFISHYYETINDDNIIFSNFNEIFNSYYINLFVLYNYYGFYIFITKEDCDSYFSVGNSYDMLTFFNLIESYIDETHKELYNKFKSLLVDSFENKQKIFIK